MSSSPQHHLLGELVVEMGFINRDQLKRALDLQSEQIGPRPFSFSSPADLVVTQARRKVIQKPRLGKILIDLKFMSEREVSQALKRQQAYFTAYHDLPPKALRKLIEVSLAVNSGMNAAEVLEFILNAANQLLDAEASTIMLLDQESGELVFSIPSGPKAEILADIRIPKGKGIAGWVAEHNEPAMIVDAEKDKRFYDLVDRQSGYHSRTMICVPLVHRGTVIGVVEVLNKRGDEPFGEQDLLILNRLADQAAATVENARLINELYTRMDQLLLREKEKYKNLLDGLTVAVVSVDSEGSIIYVNPQAAAITGRSERNFIGQRFSELFVFRNADGSSVATEELIRECRTTPGEYLFIDADGNRKWISVSIAPLDTGPNKQGFQSILRDVSREKDIQNRLLQSQRLVASGKLAGAVAYEINSPLQGIASVLDLVRSKYPDDDWLLDRIWDLDKSFVHIRDTVKKLLELNRPGTEKTQLISLNQPVSEAVMLLQGYALQEEVRLEMDLDAELPLSRLAPGMVGQVLMSLINNAVEAIPASQKKDKRLVRISTSFDENEVILRVEDTGVGIPENIRDSIFDASFSTKHAAGMGAGLAICRSVVEQHKGSIAVGDSVHGGALFTLRFPCEAGEQ